MIVEQKAKEPLLSKEMEDILYRSMAEDVPQNINTSEILRYKYKVMNMLTQNQDLLSTLHHPDYPYSGQNLNGDLFIDESIFSYLRLPDLKDTVKNYICYAVDEAKTGSNSSIISLTFRCVSHADDIRTDWGWNRNDLLGAIIIEEFDWSSAFGFHLEKVSDCEYPTNDGYNYREIIYHSSGAYNQYQKVKNNAR